MTAGMIRECDKCLQSGSGLICRQYTMTTWKAKDNHDDPHSITTDCETVTTRARITVAASLLGLQPGYVGSAALCEYENKNTCW